MRIGRAARRIRAGRFGVEALEGRQLMATFAVTSLADSGPGSLRRAILDANATPGRDTIAFEVAGTIAVGRTALPAITEAAEIDGATAPGFAGAPVVTIDFRQARGLTFARGADGSAVRSLALVRARDAGVTLDASRVAVQGNFIGLLADGSTPAGNRGDGVRINPGSRGNLIGREDPVRGVTYFNASGVSMQPVSGWQGIRDADTPGQYLITGTSGSDGLLYVGPITGVGGTSYSVNMPGAATTSVYGPDNLKNDRIRLVGSYRTGEDTVSGFLFEGTTSDLANPDNYRAIAYPGAQFTYVHSTMGGLAVGNYDGPTAEGTPIGAGRCFLYDVRSGQFLTDIVFPGSVSNTAYGIWHDGGTRYTICGGFSALPRSNPDGRGTPIGRAMLVDYDAATGQFSGWTAFDYPDIADVATHFEGISSPEQGVYTLNAGALAVGSSGALASFVTVRRRPDGGFGEASWVDLRYPGATGATTSNSVAGNQVVGIAFTPSGVVSYQATVDLGFSLSNVISANGGDGIGVRGGHDNRIAMNFIGTDATGTLARGNRRNGIRLTAGAAGNRIGGAVSGGNSPTAGVFVRPPQGNLISANREHGVRIDGHATRNVLSGNFVGTAASGNAALGNRLDGVAIEGADGNALIGCTLLDSPFVYYNVLSGNGGHGLRITNADDTTVHANFLGAGADNATLVPNGGNGMLVSGDSANTQVGGVIPLGNVASGNRGHGIEVRDRARGFVSFNTFAGLFAFGGAAPNGRNGIQISSTGGDNLVRTSIVSGNRGHGIEIGGRATGVQVTDTGIGVDTRLTTPLPNGGSGIKFSGQARGNAVGGFQPSIEPSNTISANGRYGIEFADQARDNRVVHSHIGTDAVGNARLGNALGGVHLGPNTRSNAIGGPLAQLRNTIAFNGGSGVTLRGSRGNAVVGNAIRQNATDGVTLESAREATVGGEAPGHGNDVLGNLGHGIFAAGDSRGTLVARNTTLGNAAGDVDLAAARGIRFTP